MVTRNLLRALSVLAVMAAGSCAAPDDKPALSEDGAANHPITVEPTYRSLKLSYKGTLSADDEAKLAEFVDDYLTRGNGAISISVPAGPQSSQTISALGEYLADLGVPRTHILVGTTDQTSPDGKVEIGYIAYSAHTEPCGDWSVNAADNSDNQTMPNFGCAVQQNIAAQVANPRDLVEPRGLGSADATQRMQVMNKYEQGQTTSSQKSQSQSGAVSDVGNGQ